MNHHHHNVVEHFPTFNIEHGTTTLPEKEDASANAHARESVNMMLLSTENSQSEHPHEQHESSSNRNNSTSFRAKPAVLQVLSPQDLQRAGSSVHLAAAQAKHSNLHPHPVATATANATILVTTPSPSSNNEFSAAYPGFDNGYDHGQEHEHVQSVQFGHVNSQQQESSHFQKISQTANNNFDNDDHNGNGNGNDYHITENTTTEPTSESAANIHAIIDNTGITAGATAVAAATNYNDGDQNGNNLQQTIMEDTTIETQPLFTLPQRPIAETTTEGIEIVRTLAATDDIQMTATTSEKASQENDNETSTLDAITAARHEMNKLLNEQRKAEKAVQEAEIQLQNAQKKLSSCEARRNEIQKAMDLSAEKLTDSLLQVKSSWNEMYHRLVEYKKKHGNCDVKRTLLPHEKEAFPDLIPLGKWIGKNRLEARKIRSLEEEGGHHNHPDRMEPYKIVALNRIGFDFDPRENYWMENYEKLKEYMVEHGRGSIPTRRGSALGQWCYGQVSAYNKFINDNPSYITQKKIDLLNEIGFVWDKHSNNWFKKYDSLKEFYNVHGHCRVPSCHPDQSLYRWISKETIKYRNFVQSKKPCQTQRQFELLQELNFMTGKSLETKPRKKRKTP